MRLIRLAVYNFQFLALTVYNARILAFIIAIIDFIGRSQSAVDDVAVEVELHIHALRNFQSAVRKNFFVRAERSIKFNIAHLAFGGLSNPIARKHDSHAVIRRSHGAHRRLPANIVSSISVCIVNFAVNIPTVLVCVAANGLRT